MAEPEAFDIRIENPADANEVYVFTDADPNGYEDYYYQWLRNEPSEAMIKLDMAYNRYFERIEEGWEMLVSFKNVAGEYEQYFKGVVMETRKADQSVTIIAVDYMDELSNIQLNEVFFYESHLQKGATKPGYYDGKLDYVVDSSSNKFAKTEDQDANNFSTGGVVPPIEVSRPLSSHNVFLDDATITAVQVRNQNTYYQSYFVQITLPSLSFDVYFYLKSNEASTNMGFLLNKDVAGVPGVFFKLVNQTVPTSWGWVKVHFDVPQSAIYGTYKKGDVVWIQVNDTTADDGYFLDSFTSSQEGLLGYKMDYAFAKTAADPLLFYITTDDETEWASLIYGENKDYYYGTQGGDEALILADTEPYKWMDYDSTSNFPLTLIDFIKVRYYYDKVDLLVSDVVDKIVEKTNHLTPSISGDATTTKIKIGSFIGVKGLTALKNLAIISGSEFYVDGSDNLKFEDVYEITVPESYAFYNKNDDPALVSGGSWGDTGGAEPAVKYPEIISSNLKRKTHVIANKVVVIGDTQGEDIEPPIAVAQNFDSQTTMGIVKTRTVSDKSILNVDDAYDRARELLEENLAYQIKLTVAGQYPWLVRTGFSVLDSEIGLPSWTEFKIERITVQPLTTKIDGSKLVTNIARKLSETKDDVLMSSMFRSPLPEEITNYVTASTTSWAYTPDHCSLMDSNGSEHGSADLTVLSTGVYYAFFDKSNGQHYDSTYLIDRVKVYNSGETQSVTLNVIDAGEKFFKTSNMKTIVYIYFTNVVTCGSYCETHCQASCERTCMQTCQLSCEVGSCETSCLTECEVTYCQTTCESQCQGSCLTSCQTSCQASCQAQCETAGCQTWCELKGCDTTCQLECQDSCQLGCQSQCQSFCEYSCQSACQSGIET